MAWRANLSRSVKEIRFLFCQSSPASAPARRTTGTSKLGTPPSPSSSASAPVSSPSSGRATGAPIVDIAVIVTPATDYELPASVLSALEPKDAKPSTLQKAEDIVGTMLAKGVILGRDALDSKSSG